MCGPRAAYTQPTQLCHISSKPFPSLIATRHCTDPQPRHCSLDEGARSWVALGLTLTVPAQLSLAPRESRRSFVLRLLPGLPYPLRARPGFPTGHTEHRNYALTPSQRTPRPAQKAYLEPTRTMNGLLIDGSNVHLVTNGSLGPLCRYIQGAWSGCDGPRHFGDSLRFVK